MQKTIAPFAVTKQATKIQLMIPSFELNETVMDVYVMLSTDDGRVVDSRTVHIPPDVYAKWGTDDDYIVNYVASQVGVTISSSQ
jgi:ABC-type antimicrobial peptide transport system permease subunit